MDKRKITDRMYIAAARRMHHRDGELEIDNQIGTKMVSRGEDPGAYVQAWVWVDKDDIVEEDAISDIQQRQQ